MQRFSGSVAATMSSITIRTQTLLLKCHHFGGESPRPAQSKRNDDIMTKYSYLVGATGLAGQPTSQAPSAKGGAPCMDKITSL